MWPGGLGTALPRRRFYSRAAFNTGRFNRGSMKNHGERANIILEWNCKFQMQAFTLAVTIPFQTREHPRVRPMNGSESNGGDRSRAIQPDQQIQWNASEDLLPIVYTELRKLAAQKLANEVPGQTLQPTALVHEAWL